MSHAAAGGVVPLPAPPSMHSYSAADDAGIVRARSSGKITAMQIRFCAHRFCHIT